MNKAGRAGYSLAGRRFGSLVAIAHVRSSKSGSGKYWLCRCDCGNEREVLASSLVTRRTTACGHRQVGPRSRIPAESRLWSRIRTTSRGCWEWLGARSPKGYGRITIVHGESAFTHRLAWQTTFGDIPEGMFVCHRCDNPPCVNPAHLFLGTPTDNTSDMLQKGRHRAGPKRLPDEAIEEIRKGRRVGVRAKDLANRFGVTPGYVYYVASRRNLYPHGQ